MEWTLACVLNSPHVQVALVGKQRLVLDLSCRERDGRYWVVTDRWQRFSEVCCCHHKKPFDAPDGDLPTSSTSHVQTEASAHS